MKTRQKIRRRLLFASLLLFPVTLYYFSPALSLQGAAEGVASGSVLVFAGLFASALVLGRAFCGWACPMGGLQELTARLRGRPVARRRIRWVKYLVWGPWFLLLVYFTLQAGGFRRAEFTWQTWHGISVAGWQGLFVLLAVAAVFFLPALLVGRRASCHTLCWIAPFLIAGRAARNFLAWPALRLTGRPEACQSCGSCAAACPMSIDVQENLRASGLETTDCILCGSCADACPNGALHLGFGKGRGSPPRRGRPARGLSIMTLLAAPGLPDPGRQAVLRPERLVPGGQHGRVHNRLRWPQRRLGFSVGALTGVALVGNITPAEELVGSPAFLFNPEALGYLSLSDFVRLSASLGWRTALPFRPVPGLEYWDCNGPTVSFTPR